MTPLDTPSRRPLWQRGAETAMGLCLAVMAAAVFVNVVLRYGFGSGIAASEELSRLLFVWMVFIGSAAAHPLGEHMAFTALLRPFAHRRPAVLAVMTRVIHGLVTVTCAMIAWGSWQQVMVGLDSTSVVIGYPMALLPLPAFLCAVAIGAMAFVDTIRNKPIESGPTSDVE